LSDPRQLPPLALTRRHFVTATASTAAATWLALESRELLAAAAQAAQAPQGVFANLTPDEAADLEAATAQIIPTDDLPGAREARVIYFIDKSISTFAKDQRDPIKKTAKELRGRANRIRRGASFAALTSAQQIDVLTRLEKEKPELFGALRNATIAGCLSNPEYGGNYNKAGWKMIGFDDQFSWAAPFGWYDRDV
jgi:gluconate 2-dehydrogenase gamma chain